jgi:hypothetical protein
MTCVVPLLAPSPRATGKGVLDNRARSLIEDHYDIDSETFALKGPVKHDENFARDVHDWFNIIVLIPIIAADVANWSFGNGKLLSVLSGSLPMPSLWHGDYFPLFFWMTAAYFVTDFVWLLTCPKVVRSPGVILGHHLVALLYIQIPYFYPEYGWLMGACMIVEVNTWFITARRLFNQQGQIVFTFSALVPGATIKVKLISVCFYVTWVVIRLMIYPALLVVVWDEYLKRWSLVGSPLNAITVAPIMQLVFVLLNLKWSNDLLLSKLRSGKTAAPGVQQGL